MVKWIVWAQADPQKRPGNAAKLPQDSGRMGVGRRLRGLGAPGDGGDLEPPMGVGQDVTSSQVIYQYLRKGVPTGPAPPVLDGAALSFVAKGHPGYVEPASHAAGSSSSGVPRPGQGYYVAAPAEQAPGPAALGGPQPPLPPGPKPVKAKAPPPAAPCAAATGAAPCAAAPCAAATGAAPCKTAAMGAAPGAAAQGAV